MFVLHHMKHLSDPALHLSQVVALPINLLLYRNPVIILLNSLFSHVILN